MINYMSNGKVMTTHLIFGLIKKMLLYRMNCFLELYAYTKNKLKVNLDLPNYAIQSNLKNSIGVNTSDFAKKSMF